jgi:4'-phosphopantetheinyl transferase
MQMSLVSEKSEFWIQPEAFGPKTIPLKELPLLRSGQIHLWHLDLQLLGGSLTHALAGDSIDSGSPRLNVTQLRFSRRFYLRLLLGSYLGVAGKDVVINRSNRGKPVLDTAAHKNPLNFSMAKSQDQLLIGVSLDALVGVDLEPASRKAHNALRLAERYFSKAEFLSLQSVAPQRLDEAFLRAWACNEAVVKASGLGIANQLCRFTVEINPELPPALLDIEDDHAPLWSLSLVKPKADLIGAVAVRSPEHEIVPFQLRPLT